MGLCDTGQSEKTRKKVEKVLKNVLQFLMTWFIM